MHTWQVGVVGGLVVVAQLLAQPGAAPGQEKENVFKADVVVYGGTPGGIIAAVTVAREGKRVVLLEPGKHLGGMLTGGLCATDTGNRATIGGYSRKFFNRVRAYYVKKYGAKSEQVRDCSDGFRPEPHVAAIIFKEMLAEAKVTVHYDSPLAAVGFENKIPRILNIGTREKIYFAKVFIDATYEGDLLALAGVKYAAGREGREQYNESLAGVQEFSKFHQFSVKVSPYDDNKKLLPLVQPWPYGKPGEGDKKVQAYNFRLCLTRNPDLRMPWPKPNKYDPKRFELLARYLEKNPTVKFGQLCNPVKLPNGKTDTNNNGPISTDHIGANYDYPDGDVKTRKRIHDDHVEYTKGFFYFLATDPRVPKKLQAEVNSWGPSKGEHVDNDGWPHQLYIRETRRMIGAYVMTQSDLLVNRTKPDSVGLGSYNADSHHVQRVVKDGFVINEGDFQVGVKPYAIPYRSLIPKETECTNLLVPVCVSTSHVAYGTVRMEPVFMILGQAAGNAAVLAIDGGSSVQKVLIEKLQAKLKVQKAVLSPEGLTPKSPLSLDPAKLPGIVVDDTQAKKTGTWHESKSVGPFVGAGYLHDNNENQGKCSIRFTPNLPAAGKYEVRVFYTANPNRATRVPVKVFSDEGSLYDQINQRQPLKNNEGRSLGVFEFVAGMKGYVEIRNDGANGFVVADAVQFIPQK